MSAGVGKKREELSILAFFCMVAASQIGGGLLLLPSCSEEGWQPLRLTGWCFLLTPLLSSEGGSRGVPVKHAYYCPL